MLNNYAAAFRALFEQLLYVRHAQLCFWTVTPMNGASCLIHLLLLQSLSVSLASSGLARTVR